MRVFPKFFGGNILEKRVLQQSRILVTAVALLFAAGTSIPAAAQTTQEEPQPIDLGFSVVGGDASIPLAAALLHLARNKAVPLRPELVLRSEVPGVLLRDRYGLPSWFDLSQLSDALCEPVNSHVCERSKPNGRPVWRWTLDPKQPPPADACMDKSKAAANNQRNFICIPDVTITQNITIITRRFTDPKESIRIPTIVTRITRGCETFDHVCQIRILERNPRQPQAWLRAQKSDLFAPAEVGDGERWWEELSGVVALPAALLSVAVAPVSEKINADDRCSSIEAAVRAGNAELRRARPHLGPGDGPTGNIFTSCRESIRASLHAGDRAQFLAQIPISQDAVGSQIAALRSTMRFPDAQPPSGARLIGVWDGEVTRNRSGLERPIDAAPKWQYRSEAETRQDQHELVAGNAVAWLDRFPPRYGRSPLGPCGDAAVPNDHGTVIAEMLVHSRNGLVPNSRVWSHVWDSRRIVRDRDADPVKSLDWLMSNVADARSIIRPLHAPRVANLSCAPTSLEQVQQFLWLIAGRPTSGQPAQLAPFVVAVAAGNRSRRNDPSQPDTPMDEPSGYASLSRRSETAGFISVVGLAPEGKDILRCTHIQTLIQAWPGRTQSPEAISEFCPATVDGDRSAENEPLVLYGPAFDVGAVGIGIGSDGAGSGQVMMWGSSFAAPYVTALAAQIVAKTVELGLRLDEAAANLVADRIRFTADRLDSNYAKFGRINATRALDLQRDRIELAEGNPSDPPSPEQALTTLCENAGGRIVLDNSRSQGITLPEAGGNGLNELPFRYVQRLRRIQGSVYEAIVRAKPGDALVIKLVDASLVRLPLRCQVSAGWPGPASGFQASLGQLDNFTRCSWRCTP